MDDGCVLLLAKRSLADNVSYDDSINAVVHPFHAKILSYINGGEYEETVRIITSELGIAEEKVKRFIDSLVNNEKQVGYHYKDIVLSFPKNTIITDGSVRRNKYDVHDFDYNHLDLRLKRHKTPSTLALMVNNNCHTNCIYCYADKRQRRKCDIPLERLKELIREAKKLNVVDFDLIGGEVFLYEYWKDLVKECLDNGYNPFLSTKLPVSEVSIRFLAEINIPFLQISLDSFVHKNIKSLLGVADDYLTELARSFKTLEKYGVNVAVHTIITNLNDEIEDLSSIFEFLCNFHNIRYWLPEVAGPSIYSKYDYDCFKTNRNKIYELSEYIDNIRGTSNFNIINGLKKALEEDNNHNENEKMARFLDRGLCSGNFSHMFILPTGEVTICEELYWNKRFIIGDVKKQSISEIWNSKSATDLFYLRQEDILSDSQCSECDIFHECRDDRNICYRDTIKAYGEDKWYYPDVNCPKAPKPTYSIRL